VRKRAPRRPLGEHSDVGALARFELLYGAHFEKVYAYVRRRRPSQDVADLVADVFSVAWRRLDAIPPEPDDALWFYGVARNVVSQDARARNRRSSLVTRLSSSPPSQAADDDPEDSDTSARIRELITHLKPLDQEIVRLVAWESLNHAEVAQILECSPNTVAIRWHRSIERLRRAMEPAAGAELEIPPERSQP
jgi:RNA polymerase sigma-70 factor (ECF subfamily)